MKTNANANTHTPIDQTFNDWINEEFERLGIPLDALREFSAEDHEVRTYFGKRRRIAVKDSSEAHHGMDVFNDEVTELRFWALYNHAKMTSPQEWMEAKGENVFLLRFMAKMLRSTAYCKDLARWLALTDALTAATFEYTRLHGTAPSIQYREFICCVLIDRDATIAAGEFH